MTEKGKRHTWIITTDSSILFVFCVLLNKSYIVTIEPVFVHFAHHLQLFRITWDFICDVIIFLFFYYSCIMFCKYIEKYYMSFKYADKKPLIP